MRKNTNIIQKLRSQQMDFNDLFILECFYNQDDKKFFEMYQIPSMVDFNLSVRFQFLKKNEFLVEDPNDTSKFILSVKGTNFIEELKMPDPLIVNGATYQMVMLDLGKTPEEQFEEWWKAYPTTCAWASDDGSVKFLGSRNLKNLTKPKAKVRYLKLLNQGFKHEELIGALRYEIKLKKLDSIKKNANQMEYFKGMESYFNTDRYSAHIEDFRNNPDFAKAEEKIKSKKQNVTDI